MSGHAHVYERLEVDNLTYFVNGIGGGGVKATQKTKAEAAVDNQKNG
jgi:hypothetical protein